jgi:hypothetical protein
MKGRKRGREENGEGKKTGKGRNHAVSAVKLCSIFSINRIESDKPSGNLK